MNVFFYGLFMDEQLLAAKGLQPSTMCSGYVDGFELRLGERATLIRRPNARAYGILMDIPSSQVAELYSDASVADYRPEPVSVQLVDGTSAEATCYNLPADSLSGTNKAYAQSLLALATRLGFPDTYLQEIERAGA